MLQAIGASQVPTSLGKIPLDELARAASTLEERDGVSTEWGFEIRNWGGFIDRPVARASVTSGEFMDGGETIERFKRVCRRLHAEVGSGGTRRNANASDRRALDARIDDVVPNL